MIRRHGAWFALLSALFSALLLVAAPARAAEAAGRLVTAQWLKAALADGSVLLLDASPTPQHAAGHVPGAVSADVFGWAGRELAPAAMQQRLQRWGVSAGTRIVVMDQGGNYMAPRLFWDLYYLGLPLTQLHLLDGGLHAWKAAGGAVTTERTPPPAPGTYQVSALRESARVRLEEFLAASGKPQQHALVDALEPGYYHGQTKFFDRSGHVPNAMSMPSEEFFNADKTFKSPAEIRRMAAYRGVLPSMTVHAHCGGGGAAAVPYFALHVLAGYPDVKLYNESQREWLQDDRDLPMWHYARPQLLRGMPWLAGWNGGMLRAFGLAQLSVVDVRPAEAYALNHVPYAVNLPAEVFAGGLQQPQALAGVLGGAGVQRLHEVVLVSEGGLNPQSALAWWVLDQLGHPRVSLLMASMDDWGLAGHTLTKQPTTVGPRKSPQDLAVPVASYPAEPRTAGSVAASGYPRVLVAAGTTKPVAPAGATLAHVPWRELLKADGSPKPAGELLALLQKAGVPRHAEVVVLADSTAQAGKAPGVGEAAVVAFVLRLMGWPDVKLQVGATAGAASVAAAG